MNNHRRYFRSCLAALVLALASSGSAWAAPAAGDTAPDRLGKNLAGQPVKLSHYPNQVLVIAFWAAKCERCLKQLPMLESLHKVAKGRAQVIAINAGTKTEFREAARDMSALKMMLTHDAGEKGSMAYGVNTLPHLVVIGRDRKIVEVHRGYSEEALAEIINDVNVAVSANPPRTAQN